MRIGLLTALAVALSAATQVAPASASLALYIGYSEATLTMRPLRRRRPSLHIQFVSESCLGLQATKRLLISAITITTNSPGTPTLAELAHRRNECTGERARGQQ